MLGRKPIGTEQSDAMAILRAHNFSAADRKQFIQTIFTKSDYNRNLYVVANNQYLNNTDSMSIANEIVLLQYLSTQPSYAQYAAAFIIEINKMDTLQNAVNYMNSGKMDYRGMISRFANNYFYDQINMGTQNFVTSTFQNFLFRYPTNDELANGENMVNGVTAEVFLQVGKTKQDYINIFFNSDEFIQGQVQFIFQQYLFRAPTSAEMGLYSGIYKSTNDYKQLQLAIFSTDEYAGL